MNRSISISIVVIIATLILLLAYSSRTIKALKSYETKYGLVVNQRDVYKANLSDVSNQVISLKDAAEIYRQDSANLSNDYQRNMWILSNQIDKQGIRPKDVSNATATTFTAKDSFVAVARSPCFIDTTLIHNHFSVYVRFKNDSLKVLPTYNAKAFTIIYIRAKLNKKGKAHWLLPRARWIWGDDVRASFSLDDSLSKVTHSFSTKYE